MTKNRCHNSTRRVDNNTSSMLTFVHFRHRVHFTTADALVTAIPTIKTSEAWEVISSPAICILIDAFRDSWKKRPKCPYTLYLLVMALMNASATIFIQWGMFDEPSYTDADTVDDAAKALASVNGQLTQFVSQMWLDGKLNWLLNFFALGMAYPYWCLS